MEWIVGSGEDIVPEVDQLFYRSRYIKSVTGADTTAWSELSAEEVNTKFYICSSLDGRNGCFVTAHIYDIIWLSKTSLLCDKEFVIANTCIWKRWSDRMVLKNLQTSSTKVRLWFAKQELSLAGSKYQLRESNLLSAVGQFGFLTSKSERILYANRRYGFEQAVCKAFEPVSPVLLPKDFGGLGLENLLRH